MVNLDTLVTKQLLLALDVGQVATDEIAVLLGLEGGDQVDAGPHLFAGEFSVGEGRGWVSFWVSGV